MEDDMNTTFSTKLIKVAAVVGSMLRMGAGTPRMAVSGLPLPRHFGRLRACRGVYHAPRHPGGEMSFALQLMRDNF